ncbi:hypothetical protein JTE90_029077 [Oedothorax gibbosus]|uniref:Uncharacterized protein n=1 Tax=Oedothorax gibbosus TaxID=931172 RepID=A0AAV6UWT2_9ARAC|nr:hypothetical protein JTE90_029077 [Oedothorax gibbosus]
MRTNRENATHSGAFSNRCLKAGGVLSIVVSTLFFFGNISMIVWLFEYKYPVKYSVICFMAASGVLYLTSFTSSMLLLTRKVSGNRHSRTNSDDPVTGFTQSDEIQGSYEMTANISYSGDPNVLHLPPKAILRKTPPPPYDASGNGPKTGEHLSNGSGMDDRQLRNRNPDFTGMTTNEVYYSVDEHRLQRNEMSTKAQCGSTDSYGFKCNQVSNSIESWNTSPTGSNTIKLQRAGNSQLLLQAQGESTIGLSQSSFGDQQRGFQEVSISLERSPVPSRSVIRNSSTALKRKLKTEMSKSDLDFETRKGTSTSNLNAEMLVSYSNSKSDGTSQSSCNATVESQSNMSPGSTQRFLRRGEVRTSQMNLRPPIIPLSSHSSLNMEKIFPNSNIERKKHDSISHLNSDRQQFERKSNWLMPPERQFRSNSNLSQESSFVPTERRIASSSNMKPEIQSNSSPAERQFVSQSNLNAKLPSNSDLSNPLQDQTNSRVSPARSSSNIKEDGSTLQVKNLKKIFQKEQFVVKSNDMPGLHKARSHGSLVVEATRSPQKLRTIGETSGIDDASISARRTNDTGRSTESGLNETRNSKQLSTQEWMSAWDKGIQKVKYANGERIVGVRL